MRSRRVRVPLRDARRLAVDDAATAAWLAAIPCALLTYVLVVALGPWLGDRLRPATPTFHYFGAVHPRASADEIGGFVASLSGPILLSLAVVAIVRRRPALPRAIVAGVVALAQALLALAVVACFAGQRRPAFGGSYFSLRTLGVAVVIAAVLLAASRSERLRRLMGAGESRRRRALLTAAAAAVVAIWMLPALNTDRSIASATSVIQYHTQFYLDETFSVVNGLTPLATFTPQYGALWPYPAALALVAFGKTLLTFTIALSAATGVAFLAVFGMLRRVTRNSLAALLLFVPYLATTQFPIGENATSLIQLSSWFAFYPLRYAGPLLLAWVTARQLSAPERRRPWPVFACAGLVLMNNVDMGLAALGASLAALLWAAWPRGRAQALSLAANVVGGLALAVALVSAVTLARSGSLPSVGQLTEFARIFGLNGAAAVPKPGVVGLPLLFYGTFTAAIATATVLALRRDRDAVLTGMLAWTGVFGLGSASYYIGRDILPTLFGPWALTVALLAVVAFRSRAAGASRWQAGLAFLVLVGVGISACSIAQVPAPWSQLHRLRATPTGGSIGEEGPLVPRDDPASRTFIASLADGPHRFVVRRGAPVAILATTGHRIADAYGVRNVSPYAGFEAILTVEQAERLLDVLRDAGGNTVLMPRTDNVELNRILVGRGFEVLTERGLRTPRITEANDYAAVNRLGPTTHEGFVKWVDARHLHPRALAAATQP